MNKKNTIFILVFIPICILSLSIIFFFFPKGEYLSTYAGTGKAGFADGPILTAEFNRPCGLALDADGSLLVADTYNNSIRKIKGDKVLTLAGFPNALDSMGFPKSGYVDGDMSEAKFNKPRSIVCNSMGMIYVADTGNHAIRRIYKNRVTTFAGSKTPEKAGKPGYADGRAADAMFNKPVSMCIDKEGNLYIADSLNHVIRCINKDGLVTTFAGATDGQGGYKDGPLLQAKFNEPCGITIDDQGILYVLDSGNQLIRKISGSQVSTFSGSFKPLISGTQYIQGGFKNGDLDSSEYNFPKGISFVSNEGLLIADTWNNRIRFIKNNNKVITLSGNGNEGRVDGYIKESEFDKPMGLLSDNGFIYIADAMNHCIRILPAPTGS
ncbi:MAG: hypothetical protein N2645_06015 [Clostridia bacterium]|nr:hypothetical protein [Clostridia bacterium]